MTKVYRKGAVGALMNEYERAVLELKSIVEQTSERDYEKIFDSETKNEDCRSIQTRVSHVVDCCYGYANTIREVFEIPFEEDPKQQLSKIEAINGLDEAINYTVETLEGKWEMSYKEVLETYM
jgi:uncharacterized damage-inducible protein DinB